jgi:hypothetical protein
MELRQGLIRGAVLIGLVLGGCASTREMLGGGNNGQTYTLTTTPKVPAASGQVSVSTEKDGNHTVDIKVQHMAEPEKVFEGTSTYVVWLIAPGSAPTNIGVLPVDKDLKGNLETKTPFKNFRVEVTAEASPAATQPTDGNRVMSASIRLPS